MKATKNDQPKNSTKNKVFLVGLLTLAAGLVSYFGFQFWKKNKEENSDSEKAPEPVKQNQSTAKAKVNPVKANPSAKKVNPSKVNPQPKAAPNNAGSAPKSASTQQTQNELNAALIAGAIHAAIVKKDFTAAFNQLKSIKSVSDYSAVSKLFLKTKTAGKPQTLVSGLLASFRAENQRKALTKAFNAMGLKYDGKKWSLAGLSGADLLITTQSTKVWKDPQNFVQVPPNMVLGQEIAKRGDFSLFENEKRYFLVESKTVNYYQSK